MGTVNFETMTTEQALEYCYEHADQFKAEMYACGENGERQFQCLISIVESETITPSELPSYGMDFSGEE